MKLILEDLAKRSQPFWRSITRNKRKDEDVLINAALKELSKKVEELRKNKDPSAAKDLLKRELKVLIGKHAPQKILSCRLRKWVFRSKSQGLL